MPSKFVDPASLPTMTFDWGVIKPLVAADNTEGTGGEHDARDPAPG